MVNKYRRSAVYRTIVNKEGKKKETKIGMWHKEI
jgi:hypothetical protein